MWDKNIIQLFRKDAFPHTCSKFQLCNFQATIFSRKAQQIERKVSYFGNSPSFAKLRLNFLVIIFKSSKTESVVNFHKGSHQCRLKGPFFFNNVTEFWRRLKRLEHRSKFVGWILFVIIFNLVFLIRWILQFPNIF